jgi:3-oxoacyl-[acyl-carrier protein] reductase
MGKLNGKVAVVTGASKGIGAGIAKSLAAEGASVVVNYASDREGADRTVAEIKQGGGKAVAVGARVGEAGEVTRLFDETKKVFGAPSVLVNNAGVYSFGPFADFDEKELHRQFETNVFGLLLATREAAKHFGPEGGSVINIGSVASVMNPPGGTIYSATKAAVDSITRSLARELGANKIRVNSANPGPVITEGVRAIGLSEEHEMLASFIQQTPLGRVGEPDDIGSAVAFLASDEAKWVTGQVIRVSGGLQ